jgi:hypothetical protein
MSLFFGIHAEESPRFLELQFEYMFSVSLWLTSGHLSTFLLNVIIVFVSCRMLVWTVTTCLVASGTTRTGRTNWQEHFVNVLLLWKCEHWLPNKETCSCCLFRFTWISKRNFEVLQLNAYYAVYVVKCTDDMDLCLNSPPSHGYEFGNRRFTAT